jgi:outer membrane protein OmpA-like peptidoglycan-associated protein
MSMRESSIGIVIALLVTFGLGAGSIWWAYQFGFGTNSNSVQSLTDSTPSTTAPSEAQSPVEQTPTPTATPTLTPTPQSVKKVENIQKLPIREEVNFVIDTILLTPEGREALEQLADTAVKYNSQDVVIRINVGVGESEFSQTLAENRGQEIAGILRDKGFAKKIIISTRSNGDYTKATRNKPIEVSLINN